MGAVTKTVVAEDSATWDCNVAADAANGALQITGTGIALSTILWVAAVEIVQATG